MPGRGRPESGAETNMAVTIPGLRPGSAIKDLAAFHHGSQPVRGDAESDATASGLTCEHGGGLGGRHRWPDRLKVVMAGACPTGNG